ncbi:hypothetical protein SAMN06265221_11078 [Paracoccus laeviglucosivorans]|uniref:Uncharacterized protein n=2 Tax=Paracoccus laeviglucosivorans TaxID=1197861 RepID=A0A521DXH8_9RHOB|nr:hypothetical protein SAMN06265221_11078 [Paracoccus laeviglucosivorans]
MRFIRSQHSRVPVEIADREATYLKLRQQRIADSNALFVELQDCQVAVYIQLGWDGVDELFNEILELRSEVVLAIDNMCGSIDDDTIEARRLKIEWRKIYSGDYSANDELGMKQQKAIKLLQQKLFPVARHNAGKN